MIQEPGITPQDGLEPTPYGQDAQGEQEAAELPPIVYSEKASAELAVSAHRSGVVSIYWLARGGSVVITPADPSSAAGHMLLADLAIGRPIDEVADAMRAALIEIGKRDARELAYLLAKVGEEVYGGPEGAAV